MNNQSSNFKVGDVVILKSGGPPMTIHDIGNYPNQGLQSGVLCVWFDDKKRVQDVFHPQTLELYEL